MATVNLSPWPEDEIEVTKAVRELERHLYLKYAEIDINAGEERERLELVGAAASALVERYSPGAPQRIRDLATIRTSQFILARSGGNPSKRDESLGDWAGSQEFMASQLGALRHSGSMGLLSPWKIRRARKVSAA